MKRREFPLNQVSLRLEGSYIILLLLVFLLVFSCGCGGSSGSSGSGGNERYTPGSITISTPSTLDDVESAFRAYYFESAYLISSSGYSNIKEYVNSYHIFSKDIYTRYYNKEDLDQVETTLTTDEVMFSHLFGSVGYISFDRFVEGTADRVALVVKALVNAGATSLILDLRANGGGYPGECNKLVDFFTVTSPFAIYSTTSSGSIEGTNSVFLLGESGNQNGHEQYFNASNMMILTSALTGSASEIFLAALKFFGEASQVGSVTFGKSRMVLFNRLATADGYEITVSRILHADGADREGVGILPDIETMAPFTEAYRRLSGSTAGIPEDPIIADLGFNPANLPLIYDQAYWRNDHYQAAYKALFPSAKTLSPISICEGFFPSGKPR
ncbi:MAG: S41 family peptidase [bacterium]